LPVKTQPRRTLPRQDEVSCTRWTGTARDTHWRSGL